MPQHRAERRVAHRATPHGSSIRWAPLIWSLCVSSAITGALLGGLYTFYPTGFNLELIDPEVFAPGLVKNVTSSAFVGVTLVTAISVALLLVPSIRAHHWRLGVVSGPALTSPLLIWFVWYWPWIILFPLFAAGLGSLLAMSFAQFFGGVRLARRADQHSVGDRASRA